MRSLGLILLLVTAFPLHASDDVDPWQPMNRKITGFNNFVDRWVMKPLATGYTKLPGVVRATVTNVFSNAETPAIALNQFLQGKPKEGFHDAGRFLLNTTIGLAGLFDVASASGMEKHEEDFAQTFARWGIKSGPYFVIPLRGPSTVRHATGMVLDALTNPIGLINDVPVRNVTYGLFYVNLRASVLGAESLLTGDEYLFLRDAYFQRREYLISDGELDVDQFLDDF
ncbi:MAG: VacJ family lipoprotein [Proteobacteria bacterium]|nr:VacJ family lipoprotein [Pseudomonadota bacterium]